MERLNGRRVAIMSLISYGALAGILTLLPVSLPIAQQHLPYVFALEAVVLAAVGLYLWSRAHNVITSMAYRDELTKLGSLRPVRRRIFLWAAVTNAPINFP